MQFCLESVDRRVVIHKTLLLQYFRNQFKLDSGKFRVRAERELLCNCIGKARMTNESLKLDQPEFFMFTELVQRSILTGEDCLKTHRRQERFQFQLTMFFIAESVAQCGLKIAVFSLVFKFLSRH